MKPWFSEWFDSPFYHILYSNRDEEEARAFIERLCIEIPLLKGETALDLACGKGRHSKMLFDAGLQVTGLDLAAGSIEEASRCSTDGLRFVQGDMRDFELEMRFDHVFNFFTSFGYFEHRGENLDVLRQVRKHLNPGGTLLIDFLNGTEVESSLVSNEKVIRSGVEFQLHRYLQDGHIIKDIRFVVDGREYHYREKVQDLRLRDFRSMLEAAGFTIRALFGNYELDPFVESTSKRLILLCDADA